MLGVSSKCGEVEMGERAMKKILDLENAKVILRCYLICLMSLVGSVMLNKHGIYWMRGKGDLLRFLGLLWLMRFSSC